MPSDINGEVASAVEVGCWAHGRRRFVALRHTDCRVAYPLKLITRLYRIEELADVKELSAEGRGALRRERSAPVLESLQHWLVGTLAQEPPGSQLVGAVGYVVNQWTPLTRFLDDGRLSLDNNLCNAARGITETMPRSGLCRIRQPTLTHRQARSGDGLY